MRLIKHFQPSSNIMRNYIIKGHKCIGCSKSVTQWSAQSDKPPRILCSDCEADKEDHVLAAQASLIETQHSRNALWKHCQLCTRVMVGGAARLTADLDGCTLRLTTRVFPRCVAT